MSLYSDCEDFEYCGSCQVCGDPVDSSEMGNCHHCGGVFHWRDCGSWHNNKHTCNDCVGELEGELADEIFDNECS